MAVHAFELEKNGDKRTYGFTWRVSEKEVL